MKKTTLLFTTILLFLMFNASAQKVGFQMGVNFSNLMFTNDSSFNEQKPLITPKLGFLVDIPLHQGMYISSGLVTQVKGVRLRERRKIGDVYNNDYTWYDTKEYLINWYLSVPVMFGYKYDMGGAKLFGKTGPSFDFALYSTVLYNYDTDEWDNQKGGIGEPKSLSDLDKAYFINSFDFSWNIEAGIEIHRFQISAFYSHGFSGVFYLFGLTDDNAKNRVFGANVSILFGEVDGGGRGRYRGGWRR